MDLSSFIETFFEESREGLDQMESGLLALEGGSDDPELIHVIFRAAHSLKGGSATFGFDGVTELTHVMETLLDQIRDGKQGVTPDCIAALLESVDSLRGMMAALQAGEQVGAGTEAELVARLTALLASDEPAASAPAAQPGAPTAQQGAPAAPATLREAAPSEEPGWRIWFQPRPNMLKTGNDPVRIIRELELIGDVTVEVDTGRLPALVDLAADESYLGWQIEITPRPGETLSKESVLEVFEWVEDECDLAVQVLGASEEAQAAAEPAAEVAPDAGVAPEVEKAAEAAAALASETQPKAPARSEAKAARGGKKKKGRAGINSGSIRVDTDKIDALMNMVGQLVITQSMLSQLGENLDESRMEELRDGLGQLERHTRELQESVMRIRMLPIGFSFNRFPRMVHDISRRLNKRVELVISGEQTELDKTVMERIGDPLTHLVRNGLDHGIETPEARRAAGKPETGRLHLNAFHQSGHIVIEVSDDGNGLNRERILEKARERGLVEADEVLTDGQIYDLIFHPGFSTKEEVSDLSGRGVGMDVVRSNIKELGGTIEVHSRPGEGSRFTVKLPLTLAIIDGQLVQTGEQIYILPLTSIVESIRIQPENICTMAGQTELYKLRGDHLPVLRLSHLLGQPHHHYDLSTSLLVVVEGDGQRCALLVDELLGQQQIVIKSLEHNYGRVEGIGGATILGSGQVALILDINSLFELSGRLPPPAPYSQENWSAQ